MKRLLFTLTGILSFAVLSAQCSVVEVPLVQRVNASALIVEGTVTEQYSYWNSNHTMIYTANKIQLYKIFKGSASSGAIEIITEGGTVGMDRVVVEPVLELSIGDVGIFTCEPLQRIHHNVISRNGLAQYEAYASLQGFVKYDVNTFTAADPFRSYADIQTEVYDVCAPAGHHQFVELMPLPFSAQRNGDPQIQAGPSISSIAPTTITAGTASVLTITGSNFGAVQAGSVVRFRNADDGGATLITPLASQYLSWSSTQITVEVPQNAGTGTVQVFITPSTATSAQTLTISYAHLNVDFDPGTGTVAYGPDHVNDNGSGGYTWRMNTGFDADVAARASFMRAFDTWRCATLVNWSIGATTSINDAVSDGTNIICFDNTAPLSSGILGVCYSYWSGCASGPTIIWYVNELDIIFDEGSNITPLTWEYGPATPSGSEYDFETVAVHELGHGHQLGHVISPGAIMHYAISNGTSNRSLGANDLAGGQFVQSKSVIANVCGPGAMSNTSCAIAPVAAFTVDDQSACTGQTLTFTDQSTNTPTSWSWVFAGGTPGSSNLQNPTVTYNTPGVYDVTLTATNSAGSDPETIVGYITVTACGSPPVASFIVDDQSACTGQTLSFTDQSTNSPTSWSWVFTGGTPSSSTVQNPSITYNTPGVYDVTLTATNAFGSDPVTMVGFITVTACGSPPVASFIVDDQSACTGQTLSFTDQSTNSPTSWSWVFTGGTPSSSTVQNPSITYNTPGVYDVTLTATNAFGSDPETIVGYITVTACGSPPVASFIVDDQSACTGQTLSFTDQSTNTPTSWSWVFTGGTPSSSTAQNPNITYNTPGIYDVTLTATNAFGSDPVTMVGHITVSAGPSLSIVSNPANGIVCTGNQATLTATGAQGYAWSGGITNGVAFVPPATTTYTVTGTDGNGCTSTATRLITVQSCNFTTQLNSTWCGAVNCNVGQTIAANTVSGATNYEFWFQNVSLGYSQTRQKGNSIANIPLSWISGLQYGVTYQVRVRTYVGGVWQAYGPTCTLTMAAQVPAPQLTNCAATGLTYTSALSVAQIAGAQNYEFEIINAAQPLNVVRQVGSPTPALGISSIGGIQYGRTYDCRVRAMVGGVWGPYGNTCTFTMAAAPTTQLTNCAMTGVVSTTVLSWPAISGATNYRVNVSNGSLAYNVTKAKGNGGTTMTVNQFSGLDVNNTYTVIISSYVAGAWNAYGPPCTITMGGNTRLFVEEGEETYPEDFDFGVSLYPNPLGIGANPTVTITGADQQDAMINVMDIAGRVIASYKVHCEGAEYATQLNDFPELVSGMYIMQVIVGDQVKSEKFIAE